MDSEHTDPSLRDYGKVIARRKWIVICASVSCVLVTVVLSALQTPIYAADAAVLIEPRDSEGLFRTQETNVNSRSISTEIQIIEGENVRLRVQKNLGLENKPSEVEATPVVDTDVVSLEVRDSNPANAQILADAYAVAYIEVRREQSQNELLAATPQVQAAIDDLQIQIDALPEVNATTDLVRDPLREALVNQLLSFSTTLDQLRVDAVLRTGGATLIKSADLPDSPVEPTPARSAVLGGVVGLLIGLGAAFLVDNMDDKIRNTDDLLPLTDHAVLAAVPVDHPPDNRPITLSAPGNPSPEAYRGLRTNVQFRGLDQMLRVVQVTSSLPGEGKSTTASNLAVVLAQSGFRVAIVDADLRRANLHNVFGVPQVPGLTDLLLGAAPRDVVNHVSVTGVNRLSVYPSGSASSNPSELLSGRRMRQLFTDMGQHYDFVIVDSAPVLSVSDSVALSAAAEGVLFVVRAGKTSNTNVTDALRRLDGVSAPMLGLVLNQVQEASLADYGNSSYPTSSASEAIPAEEPSIVAG